MEPMLEVELQKVFHAFQKHKIPRIYVWIVELILRFYEKLGSDVLGVIEES